MKYYRLKQFPDLIFEGFLFGVDSIPDWFYDKVASNDVILHSHSDNKILHAHLNNNNKYTTRIITKGAYYVLKGISGDPIAVSVDKFDKQFELVFISREVNENEVSERSEG